MGLFTQAQCSMITAPIPGEPFTPTADGKMCTSGVAAQGIRDATGTPAYSAILGAGIGFYFNEASTSGAILPWDATAHGVTGIGFTIDMPPVGGQMRVEFPTSAAPGVTDRYPAYWGGAGANLSPFTKAGDYQVKFTDVGGPMYLTSPTPFDPTKILSVQFHVVTNTSSTIPFSYCVSNVKALHN